MTSSIRRDKPGSCGGISTYPNGAHPRNFLDRRYELPVNQLLRAEYISVADHAASILFDTHSGPPAHDEIASYRHNNRERGHKSVRITESYYSHWIKARRERLEERVRELWK